MIKDKDIFLALKEKLDSIETDFYEHNWPLEGDFFGGLTVQDLIILNGLLHKQLGEEYESEFWDKETKSFHPKAT